MFRVLSSYPFGSPMPNREFTSSNYRYGFNGKENDPESGTQDYGMRIYNPALGKFLSVDPLAHEYSYKSTYDFSENSPIMCSDLDGKEGDVKITVYEKHGDGIILKNETYKSLFKSTGELTVINKAFKNFIEANKLPNDGIAQVHMQDLSIVLVATYTYIEPGTDNVKTVSINAGEFIKSFDKAVEDLNEEAEAEELGDHIMNVYFHSPGGGSNMNLKGMGRGGKIGKWKGPADYSDLKEPRKVGPYKKTTTAQRKRILEHNKKVNNGVLRSDEDGSIINKPKASKSGKKADMKQAEVDHIDERSEGGSNSNKNMRVVSKKQNLDKEMNRRKTKTKNE